MARAQPFTAGEQPQGGQLGTVALVSIGVGGMVGGGIFAVTGLTISLTHGAAPLAFVVAGLVALLTAASYLKLTLRFPSVGGTVEFLNLAFGAGTLTGSLSILLCLSYVILLAVYAYAFGSYGVTLTGGGSLALHALASAVLVLLAVLNYLGPHLVIRSENAFNAVKMVILAAFVGAGLVVGGHWSSIEPARWVGPVPLVAGAMVIFLNYEGFELIANAAPQARTPKRSLPVAYLGGTIAVLVLYVAIAAVTLGHIGTAALAAHSDAALSFAARAMVGHAGSTVIAVAALAATSSAINATYYGSGRLTYLIAKHGDLPAEFERDIRNQPLEGMILFAVLSLALVNVVPLDAIATMGSVGFLIVFAAVNIAAWRLADQTGGRRSLAALGAAACGVAFVMLVGQTFSTPGTRWQGLGIAGVVAFSWAVEAAYRSRTGRRVHMGHEQLGVESP
jgi:amino acid transporter